MPNAASIEHVREYWDRRPCNIRHSTAPVGTREYFDQVEARKYMVEPHIPEFAQFDLWKNKRVLEIGCGIGTDAVNFARAGAHYTGTDLSPASLELAQKRFKIYGLPGRFLEANAEDLAQHFSGQTFDLIYAFGVLHHTPNPDIALQQIAALMSADSELRLMLYAAHSWKAIMIEHGFDQPEAQNGCPIANVYTEDQIRELLRDFEILQLRQDHIFPYVIESYLQYQYVKQPWFESMPEKMFRALEQSLGWHTLIRCKKKTNNSTSR